MKSKSLRYFSLLSLVCAAFSANVFAGGGIGRPMGGGIGRTASDKAFNGLSAGSGGNLRAGRCTEPGESSKPKGHGGSGKVISFTCRTIA